MKSRFGTLSGLLALAAIVVGLLPGLTLAQPEPDAQKMPASPPPNVAAPAPGAAPSLEPPPPAQGPQDAIQRLAQDTGGTARVTLSRATGVAKFIRLQAGSLPYRLKTPGPQAAVEQGQAFLAAYGAAFGIADPGRELELVSTQTDQVGGLHVLYRQVYRGVPVFAGLLKIHFDAGGALVAANGTFIPNLKLNPTPLLNAEQVTETALRRVIRQQTDENEFAPFGLAAKHAALLIFRANLARGIPSQNHLAFEVEVTNGATVREFVYVDAHSGQIIDQISGIHQMEREISEAPLSNVVWDEGNGDPDPIPGGWAGGTAQQVTDWQNELDGALETYNLFASMSGGNYLSYDSNDAIMRTVNNDPGISCPNANWNGVSTNYCSNVTGDDTVAHEWGHAYTEYTSNLIYQWQSGALNESYSDMWGEVVDLLNGRGADAPGGLRTDGGCSTLGIGAPSVDNTYRWLSGEDDPAFGGAIRDMWNPPCYGDPGHVLDSTNYWCAAGDGGGVHTNSGVPNHAFALLVDGGTYTNSTTTITVTAIGITKTAHIHWLAQQMLTPASGFTDHADALEAACTALTGQPLFELSTA
ncbi:MAG: M4 family metallopeptidase, partial [Anaerolineae bacterium]